MKREGHYSFRQGRRTSREGKGEIVVRVISPDRKKMRGDALGVLNYVPIHRVGLAFKSFPLLLQERKLNGGPAGGDLLLATGCFSMRLGGMFR